MRSLQIYEEGGEKDKIIDISELEPEKLVTEVCEPIAQIKLLKIFQDLIIVTTAV